MIDIIKPTINFNKIGKKRFILGILIGITSFISLYLLLNGGRDSLRVVVTSIEKYKVLNNDQIYKSNLIFAGLSFVFALGCTLRLWFGNIHKKTNLKRHKLRSFLNNSRFSIWVTLYWFTKTGALYGIWLLSFTYYQYFSIINTFHIWFYLLIIVNFFNQWNELQLMVKCKKLMYGSLVLLIISSLLIANFNLFNSTNYNKYIKTLRTHNIEYLTNEFKRAESLAIKFSDIEKKELQKKHAPSCQKWRFIIENNLKEPNVFWEIKALVVHKIFIHNLHYSNGYEKRVYFNKLASLYESLKKYDPSKDKLQVQLFFEIFKEYEDIINPKMDFTDKEITQLSIQERIRYDNIYYFLNEYPEHWKTIKKHEILNLPPPEVDSTEIETIEIGYNYYDDFPDREKQSLIFLRKKLKNIIYELQEDPKYKVYWHILK